MAKRRREDDGEASSEYNVVFVDTSLDTHLAMPVSDSDTVSHFKERVEVEHMNCFPEIGKIHIRSLKIKRGANFYRIPDSMIVWSVFLGEKKSWSLSADVSKISAFQLCQLPSNGDIKHAAVTDSKDANEMAGALLSDMNIRSNVLLSLPGADSEKNMFASIAAEVEDPYENVEKEIEALKRSTNHTTEKDTFTGMINELDIEKSSKNAVVCPGSTFSDGNSSERKSRRRKKRKVCPEVHTNQDTILEDSSHLLDESVKDPSDLKIVVSKDSKIDAAKEGLGGLFSPDNQVDPSQVLITTNESEFINHQYDIETCGDVFDRPLSPSTAKKSTNESQSLIGNEIGNQVGELDHSLVPEESVPEESFVGKKDEKKKKLKKNVHPAVETLDTTSKNLGKAESMNLPCETQNVGAESVREEGLDVKNCEEREIGKEDVNAATEILDTAPRKLVETASVKLPCEDPLREEKTHGKKNEKRKKKNKNANPSMEILGMTSRDVGKTESMKLPCETPNVGAESVREEGLDVNNCEEREMRKEDVNTAPEVVDKITRNLDETESVKLPSETQTVGEDPVREEKTDGKKNEKRKKKKKDVNPSMEILDTTSRNVDKTESMKLPFESENVAEESAREENFVGKKKEKRKKRKKDVDTDTIIPDTKSRNLDTNEATKLICEAQNVGEAKDVLSVKQCSELPMESSNCKTPEFTNLDLTQKETGLLPPSTDLNEVVANVINDIKKNKKKRKNRTEATMDMSGMELSADLCHASVNKECGILCNEGIDSQLNLDSAVHSNEKTRDVNIDGLDSMPLKENPQPLNDTISGKENMEEIAKESQELSALERGHHVSESNGLKANLEGKDEKSRKRKKKSKSTLAGVEDTIQDKDPEFDNLSSKKENMINLAKLARVSNTDRPLFLSQRSNEVVEVNQGTPTNASDIETPKKEGQRIDFHKYFGSGKKVGKDEMAAEECESNEGVGTMKKHNGRNASRDVPTGRAAQSNSTPRKIPVLSSSRKQMSASIDEASACNSETSHQKKRNPASSRPAWSVAENKAVKKTAPIKLRSVFETDSEHSYEDEKGKARSGSSTNSPSSSSSESIHTNGESEVIFNSGASKATPSLVGSGSKDVTMGMLLRNSQTFKQALNRASSQAEIKPTDSQPQEPFSQTQT